LTQFTEIFFKHDYLNLHHPGKKFLGWWISDVIVLFSDVKRLFSDVNSIFSDVNPKKSD